MPINEDKKLVTKHSFIITCCNCGNQVELGPSFSYDNSEIEVCVHTDTFDRRSSQVNIECCCGNDIYQD